MKFPQLHPWYSVSRNEESLWCLAHFVCGMVCCPTLHYMLNPCNNFFIGTGFDCAIRHEILYWLVLVIMCGRVPVTRRINPWVLDWRENEYARSMWKHVAILFPIDHQASIDKLSLDIKPQTHVQLSPCVCRLCVRSTCSDEQLNRSVVSHQALLNR